LEHLELVLRVERLPLSYLIVFIKVVVFLELER
jgi:hypothetical protein